MTEKTSFTIAYDGSALRSHTMDVRDLGPALLSFGQLFDESNRVLNGDKVLIRIHVKAQQPGSFEIVFEATQSLASQMSDFLTGDFVTSVLNLKELLFGGTVVTIGLFKLIKKIRGRKLTRIQDLKNGLMRIETADESFDVPLKLLRLYQDVGVRTSVEKVLKPLESEGVDTFLIKDQGQEIERIDHTQKIYFDLPQIEDEQLTETVTDTAYSIISLAFKEDNEWRLFDGNTTINVSIKDEDFLRRVDENLVSFSKGDILLCSVRTSQWKTSTGLKTDYEVLKVHEHRPAARQLILV